MTGESVRTEPEVERWEVIIIGGGAAGLSAAVYAGRAGRRTLLLERKFLGGQIALTDLIANYPGFPEGIEGPDLVRRMEEQARKFGAEILFAEVTGVEREGREKLVYTEGRTYRTPIVIVATGADPRPLKVPGEERLRGRGVSYCGVCDGPFFRGREVVVVGGGDAALKEALFLTNFASRVTLVHRRDAFRAERIYQDRVRAHPGIELVLSSVVEEILGGEKVEAVRLKDLKTGRTFQHPTDAVFIFIGNEPNTGFLERLFPDLAPGSHLPTDQRMETAVEGVYAVGDVRAGSFRQIATAVGEGVTAALAAEERLSEWGYDPGR